jgi:hypothetical protein
MLLILVTIFGLLLHDIIRGSIMMIDLVTMDVCACITSDYPSRGIASFIFVGCVGSTERARIDVSSEDIDLLPFVIVCTDSYSRTLYGIGISII